jgi:hypothetical protein
LSGSGTSPPPRARTGSPVTTRSAAKCGNQVEKAHVVSPKAIEVSDVPQTPRVEQWPRHPPPQQERRRVSAPGDVRGEVRSMSPSRSMSRRSGGRSLSPQTYTVEVISDELALQLAACAPMYEADPDTSPRFVRSSSSAALLLAPADDEDYVQGADESEVSDSEGGSIVSESSDELEIRDRLKQDLQQRHAEARSAHGGKAVASSTDARRSSAARSPKGHSVTAVPASSPASASRRRRGTSPESPAGARTTRVQTQQPSSHPRAQGSGRGRPVLSGNALRSTWARA